MMKPYVLFSGVSNRPLADGVAHILGTQLGNVDLTRFADGELRPWVQDDVRDKSVFVLESLSYSMDEHIMEVSLMGDAIRRSAPSNMIAVIPYMGYARQDKQHRPGEPVSARVIAKFLEVSKYKEVIAIDLHNDAIVGFFQIPVAHLTALPILAEAYTRLNLPNPLVVSPDVGGVKRARNLAFAIDTNMVVMEKRRFIDRNDTSEAYQIIGDVKGKDAVIIDDLISTGGTIAHSAEALMQAGATSVSVLATHAVFAGEAIAKLEASPVSHVIVTDTINQPQIKGSSKISVVSVAPLIAEAMGKMVR